MAAAGAAMTSIAKTSCAQVNKLTSSCREDEEPETDCPPLHCLIARCPQQEKQAGAPAHRRPQWQEKGGARRRVDRYELVETRTVFRSPFPGAEVSEARRAVLLQEDEADETAG